jgi:hypothetical protein
MTKLAWFIIFIAATGAVAQTSNKGYQFNTSGTVNNEFDRQMKFKLPTEATADGKAEVVKTADNDAFFKTPLGYPKKEIILSYNPGVNGFKNVLTSRNDYTFNFTNNSIANFDASFRYNTSVEDFFGIAVNMMRVTVPAFRDTTAGFSIDETSVYLTSFLFSGYFCTLGATSYNKICPGFEVGLDSYPVLDFVNNSRLDLVEIRDMVIGPSLIYTKPLGPELNLMTKVSYAYGLATGQSNKLGVRGNQRVSGQIGVEFPWQNTYLDILGGLDYRTAKVRSTDDEWQMTNLAYNARLGVRWEWGSPFHKQ